jgi:hypothetical protein
VAGMAKFSSEDKTLPVEYRRNSEHQGAVVLLDGQKVEGKPAWPN